MGTELLISEVTNTFPKLMPSDEWMGSNLRAGEYSTTERGKVRVLGVGRKIESQLSVPFSL